MEARAVPGAPVSTPPLLSFMTRHVLTLNAGSSSLKFALFRISTGGAQPPCETLLASGLFERIGLETSGTKLRDTAGAATEQSDTAIPSHAVALERLFGWLERAGLPAPEVVGHRVVHGGPHYTRPERVDETLLAELRRLSPFDTDHLPVELEVMAAAGEAYPELVQVACFDTAFHRGMPRESQLLPLPRAYADEGIVRYGFHGLSYEYILGELAAIQAPPARVIIAHLGGGCSLAAVRDGRPFDTTMGFTPAAGLMMGTRSGDLDPGLVLYLMQEKGLSAEDFNRVVNKESGLLGLSGLGSDLRDLLAREADHEGAAEALAVFCHIGRKFIGALAAGLGGLDALVFTAGIGEHSAVIRRRLCEGLGFLGVELDAAANEAHARTISTPGSPATVHVIPTNEELMIARHTAAVLVEKAELSAAH